MPPAAVELACKLPCEAVPFDKDAHGRFLAPSGRLLEVKDAIRRGGACLVAHVRGYPGHLVGWASVDSRLRVVWAYTKPGLYRRRHVMTALLLELGVDLTRPVPCLNWTDAAAAIAEHGYHVFPVARRTHEGHAQAS